MAFYLLEVTYTGGKEVPALYPTEGQTPYADEVALTADIDTKLGQAMDAEAYKAEYLLGFDSAGNIIDERYHFKDAEINFSPRVVKVTVKDSTGEVAEQNKATSLLSAQATFYKNRGAAKKNADVKSLAQLIVAGSTVLDDFKDCWVRPTEPEESETEPEEVTE